MAKRMILMLAVMVVFIAGLGFVKFRQIPGDGGAVRRDAAAARGGHDDRRRARGVAGDAQRDRHRRRRCRA